MYLHVCKCFHSYTYLHCEAYIFNLKPYGLEHTNKRHSHKCLCSMLAYIQTSTNGLVNRSKEPLLACS